MPSDMATMLCCLVLMMFCILLVLSRIEKTLKNSGESLSKIAKHFEEDEKDKD
jgi:amino acid permease